MTVAELDRRMSSRELTEWMAYFEVEPWGEERADLRSGIVASVIANANRDPKKRKQPFAPADFMPYATRPATDPPPAETLAARTERIRQRFTVLTGGLADGDDRQPPGQAGHGG